MSFLASAAVHGGVLLWVVAGAALQQDGPRQTIYEQEIKPNLHKLIWYDLRERLPDVRPSASGEDKRPARARLRARQAVVAGKREDVRAPQMIWMPAPPVEMPKALKLPNVLAVAAAPRPVREFKQPQPQRATAAAPVLAEAPKLSESGPAKVDLGAAMPHPQRKAFTAPAPVRRTDERVELAAAPEIALAQAKSAAPAVDAPAIRPVRAFAAPVVAKKVEEPVEVAAAPEMTAAPSPVSMAIVGLNPAKTVEGPKPPGSHEGEFSAGPTPRPDGGQGAAPKTGMLVVPGLMASGGGKGALPALSAAIAAPLRSVLPAAGGAPSATVPRPGAARVASSPDPRMDGRAIYTLAIQMANVTSYSGSWLVWFAEHRPEPGERGSALRPPAPLRKVDPKYVVTAVEERVEGTVRLAAVVRKDGHVERIEVLKHLDDRLDRSAEEALGKWVFEPAQRDGEAVDIDAVFEIPFRLPPKPKR